MTAFHYVLCGFLAGVFAQSFVCAAIMWVSMSKVYRRFEREEAEASKPLPRDNVVHFANRRVTP